MKFFTTFLLILLSISVSAQKVKKSKNEKTFYTTIVTLNDGTILNVLLGDLYDEERTELPGFIGQSLIKNDYFPLNIRFPYKDSENGEVKFLKFDDIHRIKVLNNEESLLEYERLIMKQLDRKNNWVDKNYSALVPILYEGKINMYGFTTFLCEKTNCMFANQEIFMKKPDSDFAIAPVDTDITILGVLAGRNRTFDSLIEIGKDCVSFKNYIEDLREQFKNKENRKTEEKMRKDTYEKIYEQAKLIKEYKESKDFLDSGKANYETNFWLKFIKEYEKNCQ